MDVFQELQARGAKTSDTGHFCLSPKRGNSVTGNVVHAAVYHGNYDILNNILR